MPNYNHVLLLTDATMNEAVFTKANDLASCFGARLSIGYCLPNMPVLASGVINLESECRDLIKSQLCAMGRRYKIPLEDQWVLTQDKNEPLEKLRKNGIDLIIVSKSSQSLELCSQLASKILQEYSCAVLITPCWN